VTGLLSGKKPEEPPATGGFFFPAGVSGSMGFSISELFNRPISF